MNIAIVGRSQLNSILRKHLIDEGFIPLLFDSIDDVKSITGERGSFSFLTERGSIQAGYIIVTEEPAFTNAGENTAAQSIPVMQLAELENLDKLGSKSGPVVILLDFPCESSARMTALALDKAIRLVRKQRKVICLARFMRTGEKELEQLYKEARNTGVSFIKYNEVSVDYKEDENFFVIRVADDFESFVIETGALVSAGKIVPGEKANKIIKALQLKTGESGFVNGDRFFVFPALTNRKGVYYLDASSKAVDEGELMSRLLYITSEIKNDFDADAKFNTSCSTALKLPSIFPDAVPVPSDKNASIDAGKCAFCYTCFRACPHSAMAPDYDNSVMKNLKRGCYGCGICVSVCPADAIRITEESSEAGENVQKSLEIFCCKNSGEIAAGKLKDYLKDRFEEIGITPVDCGGEVSAERIIAALRHSGKILVVTCIDDACRHFEGNKRARRQVEKARELLKASGMDENRVECVSVSHAMPLVLGDYVKEMI